MISNLDYINANLDALETLVMDGRATEGDAKRKWQANTQSNTVFRIAAPEVVEVLKASVHLCTRHGGCAKTRLMKALVDLDIALAPHFVQESKVGHVREEI